MKILLSIIVIRFVISLTISQTAFGSPALEYQLGNSSTTERSYDDSILILNQTTQKPSYKMGENIVISTELINAGSNSVDITYCLPWIALEIKDHTGDEVWPKSQLGCIPEFSGNKTLQPEAPLIVKTL